MKQTRVFPLTNPYARKFSLKGSGEQGQVIHRKPGFQPEYKHSDIDLEIMQGSLKK